VKSTIIIAAISSRVYVQAAVQAGFEVIAIDAFCDVDTQASCKQVFQIGVQNGQFNAAQLLAVLNKIDLNNCLGLSYGAGFEAQPDLLASINQRISLLGNTPNTVAQIKNPQSFFDFCDTQHMPHPVTRLLRPSGSKNWLQKRIGGSGGVHIMPVLPIDFGEENAIYYQHKQAGTSYSCLFVANGSHAQMIGFNEQWCNPSELLPYRYGGAVSHADLGDAMKHKLEQFVQVATVQFGLRGINSCDFLVQHDTVYMLEINPRLSASLQLYSAKKGDLFAAHIDACMGNLNDWPTVEQQSCAHQVVYANKTAQVPITMDWPEWVCDIPQPHSQIPAGAPLCTVVASARSAKLAKRKVLQRAASL
jgi:uncharacterized protein